MNSKTKQLVKLLGRLTKQDHLYSGEKIKEMKALLRDIKKELAQIEAQTSKGFGKK